MHDLLLKGGRVIDPARGVDQAADVAFAEGRVAEIGPDLSARAAREVRDASGRLVVPGLIDLHTHVYWGGTSAGVDPEALARQSATTTLVDAGTAGPANLAGFRRHVIEPATPRVLPYLNVSFPGIFALSDAVLVGECEDLRLLNARECVRVAREHADLVVGIKVRCGLGAGGSNGIAPLDIAIEVAEELGLPVMAHLDFPPPSRREVMERLRPGDVLTHCFRSFPNSPARADGSVREETLAARERGVIFDIGHGKGSFGFGTGRAMLAAGFLPTASRATRTPSASTAPRSIFSSPCRSSCASACRSSRCCARRPAHRPRRCAGRISAASSRAWPRMPRYSSCAQGNSTTRMPTGSCSAASSACSRPEW